MSCSSVLFALEIDFGRVLEKIVDHLLEVILTVIIVSLLLLLWRRTGFLITRLFATITVKGVWRTTLTRHPIGADGVTIDKDEEHEDAKLDQLFNYVWGETTTVDEGHKVYKLKGRIIGDKLFLRYERHKGTIVDNGGIVLEIDPEGKSMEGYEVGIDLKNNNKIDAFPYRWVKRGPY